MAETDSRPELVPDLHQGKYSDGHPLDDVHYLEWYRPRAFDQGRSGP